MNPKDPDRERLGHAIRAARTAAGLNQRQAAEAIGISNRTLSDIENGHTGQPAKLRKALDYFGIEPDHPNRPKGASPTARVAADLVLTWIDAVPSNSERQARSDHVIRSVARYQADPLRQHIRQDDLAAIDADLAENPPAPNDENTTGLHRFA